MMLGASMPLSTIQLEGTHTHTEPLGARRCKRTAHQESLLHSSGSEGKIFVLPPLLGGRIGRPHEEFKG